VCSKSSPGMPPEEGQQARPAPGQGGVTLRVTPAMAAEVTKWGVGDLVALLEGEEAEGQRAA
jgi:hypothetical protein